MPDFWAAIECFWHLRRRNFCDDVSVGRPASFVSVANANIFAQQKCEICYHKMAAPQSMERHAFFVGKEILMTSYARIFLGFLFMMAVLAACAGGNGEPAQAPMPEPAASPYAAPILEPAAPDEAPPEVPSEARPRPETDREGFPIVLPDEINSIVTLGPSNAEILIALGFGERIIAADRYSGDVDGLGPGVVRAFGILDFDAEYIMGLGPDVIFVTGMARAGGDDPLAPITAAGITVIYMPSSESLDAIMEDIRFMAAVMEAYEAGEAVVAAMRAEIDEIRAIAEAIALSRTVYFEISPAPWMFSFGRGTFLHEMIELVGATNVFADYSGWIPVADEVLLELNPDIILTSTDFLDDPIAEIAGRPGFGAIAAVQNGDIFRITAAYSQRPSQNVTRALWEIARAVFPEYFMPVSAK